MPYPQGRGERGQRGARRGEASRVGALGGEDSGEESEHSSGWCHHAIGYSESLQAQRKPLGSYARLTLETRPHRLESHKWKPPSPPSPKAEEVITPYAENKDHNQRVRERSQEHSKEVIKKRSGGCICVCIYTYIYISVSKEKSICGGKGKTVNVQVVQAGWSALGWRGSGGAEWRMVGGN